HEPQEINLALCVRSEIGMPAFRGHHFVARAIPEQDRFAKPRSGSQQRAARARHGHTFIEHAKIFGREMLQAVSRGTQIVEQHDGFDVQLLGEMLRIDDPGKIGGMDAVVDHRSGHAKARGPHFFVAQVRLGLAGKLFHQQVKLGKALAGEALPVDHFQLPAVFGEQRQISFGTADITGEDHGASRQSLVLNRFNKKPVKIASLSLRASRLPVSPRHGLYHCRPSRSSNWSDSRRPQVPEAYCGTLRLFAALQTSRTGSTSDHAASTESPRSNSVGSPLKQSFSRVAYAVRDIPPKPS